MTSGPDKLGCSLSVIMITKNAQRTLRQSLQSVQSIASEIIIIDSGSTDDTLVICHEFTDQVFSMDWPGFGMQKQRALDKASCDWVLSLDSDEVLTSDLADEIQLIVKGSQYDGFSINRHMRFYDKVFKLPIGKDQCLRLFKRECGRFSACHVHERVIVEGVIGKLKSYMIHYSYESISHWMTKMNEYTSIASHEKSQAGKKCSLSKAIMSSMFTFIRFYFFKGGILEGKMGFVFSVNSAINNYYKYLKLAIDE